MSEPRKVATFEKVSFEEFLSSIKELTNNSSVEELGFDLKKLYDNIKLPTRATKGSAGYDFYAPFSFVIENGTNLVVPTGIRCHFLDTGYSLDIYPKSGLGFKHGLGLANTIGIIDSDYYYSDNEGHIKIKLTADMNLCFNYFGYDVDSEDFTDQDPQVDFTIKAHRLYHHYDDTIVHAGEKFVQGIFHPYGITEDDNADGIRNGGMGSTGK